MAYNKNKVKANRASVNSRLRAQAIPLSRDRQLTHSALKSQLIYIQGCVLI